VNQDLISLAVAAVMPAAVATGEFRSLLSVQAPTPASGAISGTYTPVSGLQNIACKDAPESFGGLSVLEVKALPEVSSMSTRHVLLDKWYPLLSPATNWGNIGWQAVVDGNVYDILGAENDSDFTQTRLKLRKVTV